MGEFKTQFHVNAGVTDITMKDPNVEKNQDKKFKVLRNVCSQECGNENICFYSINYRLQFVL